jgi:hypothetical protein
MLGHSGGGGSGNAPLKYRMIYTHPRDSRADLNSLPQVVPATTTSAAVAAVHPFFDYTTVAGSS